MRLLTSEDNLEGLGIGSTLYRNQRRSVAAMLKRELDERYVPHPLYIPLTTVDETQYFLQPETMEIKFDRPMTSHFIQGGILCGDPGAN